MVKLFSETGCLPDSQRGSLPSLPDIELNTQWSCCPRPENPTASAASRSSRRCPAYGMVNGLCLSKTRSTFRRARRSLLVSLRWRLRVSSSRLWGAGHIRFCPECSLALPRMNISGFVQPKVVSSFSGIRRWSEATWDAATASAEMPQRKTEWNAGKSRLDPNFRCKQPV